MSINRDKIIRYTEKLLQVEKFEDFCHNGLQIAGQKEIKKIITGVSLSRELIETAIKEKAQMLMVHHGIFINDIPSPFYLEGIWLERLELLLRHKINLSGWHLPLDAHPHLGNNISIAKILKLRNIKPFDIGFIGEVSGNMNFDNLINLVKKEINSDLFVIGKKSSLVKKIAVISGAASRRSVAAVMAGADTFITGDIRESGAWFIKEQKINFINAGHYATEVFGIKNLGEHLAEKFNIQNKFIDIPCAV